MELAAQFVISPDRFWRNAPFGVHTPQTEKRRFTGPHD
jgi:hypothetical protein